MGEVNNRLLEDATRQLRDRLPPGWSASAQNGGGGKASVTFTGPDRRKGVLTLAVRASVEPREVAVLVEAARAEPTPTAVLCRYLSVSTRERLREHNMGYLDLTGNVRVALVRPGLFLETHGASQDPNRSERPARSLRGAKAGRLVRELVDNARPVGVRDLAANVNIDAGYVSRVLAFLDAEALVRRVGRGRLEHVDWPALLRRWAADAPLEARGRVTTWLDPRGAGAFVTRLAGSKEQYAITGSFAAARVAPIAPSRLATVWVSDADGAADRLDLRAADTGANVMLIELHDDYALVGSSTTDGIWYAAPSQVVADLLTSPGRGPAEAEALITWMLAHQDEWRT